MTGVWSNFVLCGYFYWLAYASWTNPYTYLCVAFWAWMIYDAVKNDPERIWLWVVLILGPFGAVVYFCFARFLPSTCRSRPSCSAGPAKGTVGGRGCGTEHWQRVSVRSAGRPAA